MRRSWTRPFFCRSGWSGESTGRESWRVPFWFWPLPATGDVNRAIAAEARSKGALANNASDCRDCDFFFPAVVLAEEWTAGLTGAGENHRAVKEAAAKIREMAPETMH